MAQTPQKALKYNINIDARNVFTSGIQANTKIFLRKLNNDSVIAFNLLKLAVDSVYINQNLTSFQKNDSTVLIKIPFQSKIGDSLTVDIFYKGIPQKDALWGGFYVSGTYAFNMGVGFQSKPHNF